MKNQALINQWLKKAKNGLLSAGIQRQAGNNLVAVVSEVMEENMNH